jgi:hypothetical protein
MTSVLFSQSAYDAAFISVRPIGPLTKHGIFTPCKYEPPPVEHKYECPLTKEINRLRLENKQLYECLNYLTNNSAIYNDSTELYNAKKSFEELFHKPMLEEPPENSFFFTLTFDPDKFGLTNSDEDEEDYILIILHKMYKDPQYNVSGIYLCFEKTKAGVIHAHGLILSSPGYMKVNSRYLKLCFTNNPRNRRAIQYELPRPRAYEYIAKDEPYKRWFKCGNFPLKLDYDL